MLRRAAEALIGLERLANRAVPTTRRWANLSGLSRDLAFMSKWAYQPRDSRAAKVGSWDYDKEASTDQTAVYQMGNTVALAFRGTAEGRDIATDIKVAVGSFGSDARFQDAVKLATEYRNQGKNVIATGHSLGGTIAMYLNSVLGVPVEVFNPGMGVRALGAANPNGYRAVIHVIQGDPISALAGLSRLGRLEAYGPKVQPAHTIDNFL